MNGKNWNIFSDNDESSSKKLCKINVKKKSENKWTGNVQFIIPQLDKL